MAGVDTSLKDTLATALKDTKDTSDAKATDTEKDISQSQAVDTKSGETTVEMSGIKVDLSDIPEQDRPRFRKALEEKLKLGDRGIKDKLREVADERKKVESLENAMIELTNLGYTPEQALDTLKKSKMTASEQTKVSKGFEKKIKEIENSTLSYEEKQTAVRNLQDAQALLREETGIDEMSKKIASLEQMVSSLVGTHQATQKSKIETDIATLEGEYGKDLIEKYHDLIVDEALKYNVSPQKILFYRADPSEIEQAISQKSSRKKEKLNAVSSAGSGVASATEAIDTKQSFGNLLREIAHIKK